MKKNGLKDFFKMNLYQWVMVVVVAGTLFWGIASYAMQISTNSGKIVTLEDTISEMSEDVARIDERMQALHDYFLGGD